MEYGHDVELPTVHRKKIWELEQVMLTRLVVRNFKRLRDAQIPLEKTVVLIGPNNSGKTTALQALALWDVGLRAWNAKREGKSSPEKRPGVAINRRDLISTPVPIANLLWHGLHVRRGKTEDGRRGTENIRIDIAVSGITDGRAWDCGLEFDFSNEESFVCRPLRLPEYVNASTKDARFQELPPEAGRVSFAFLPPMSGLAAEEPLLQQGRINVLMGQGQTAQVLRNLCYQIVENDRTSARNDWCCITENVQNLFGAKLSQPLFLQDRGEITLAYEEKNVQLDISASGRGLQQTLLLLAHLYANPNTVLLLDEPDAHLEILRQREIFRVINDVAEKKGSQVIAASHSEVILNEAASTAIVVAFVGKPHILGERTSQVYKALCDIEWEDYYKAEQTGWVLYLEGSTDLEILRKFATTLEHEKAILALARPFVHYISTNQPQKAREHFFGLQEAKPDLIGIAIFDRLDKEIQSARGLTEHMWRRREIENYFCTEDVLLAYARHDQNDDLFGAAEAERRVEIMKGCIDRIMEASKTLGKPGGWSIDIKATDDFLDPLFKNYFDELGIELCLRKKDYHILAGLMLKNQIDTEVREKLDAIVSIASQATLPEE